MNKSELIAEVATKAEITKRTLRRLLPLSLTPSRSP